MGMEDKEAHLHPSPAACIPCNSRHLKCQARRKSHICPDSCHSCTRHICGPASVDAHSYRRCNTCHHTFHIDGRRRCLAASDRRSSQHDALPFHRQDEKPRRRKGGSPAVAHTCASFSRSLGSSKARKISKADKAGKAKQNKAKQSKPYPFAMADTKKVLLCPL